MATIKYDAMVNVQLRSLPDVQGQVRTERTWRQITLASAVRLIRKMPTSEQGRASILLDPEAGLREPLEIDDIEAVSRRTDFPQA